MWISSIDTVHVVASKHFLAVYTVSSTLTYTGSVPVAEWLVCAFVLQITTGDALPDDTNITVSRAAHIII